MNSQFKSICVAAAMVAAYASNGCVGLKVQKVDPDNPSAAPGMRYALPKPLLQVTPNDNGTMTVEVIYVPDDGHTYAIDASNFASSQELNVEVDGNGFLKKVTYNPNPTEVAKEATAAAGDAAKQTLEKVKADADAEAAKKKEEGEARAAAKKERIDAYKTASAELDEAIFEQKVAEDQLAFLLAQPADKQVPATIQEQRQVVTKAKRTVELKQKARDEAFEALKKRDLPVGATNDPNAALEVVAKAEATEEPTAADAKKDAAAKATDIEVPKQIPGTRKIAGHNGPVLFAIRERDFYEKDEKKPLKKRVIRLEALSVGDRTQMQFNSKDLSGHFAKPETPTTAPSTAVELKPDKDLKNLVAPVDVLTFTAASMLHEVIAGESTLKKIPADPNADPLPVTLKSVVLDNAKTKVTVSTETPLDKGDYVLLIKFKTPAPAGGNPGVQGPEFKLKVN